MNRKIAIFFFLFIPTLYFSCHDTNVKKVKTEDYFEGYTPQDVDFLNKKVYIPEIYTKIEFAKLREELNKLPALNKSEKYILSLINSNDNKSVIFLNQNNYFLTIQFREIDYWDIQKNEINSFVNYIEGNIINKSEIKFERLEVKYLEINRNKAIKIKYKQDVEPNRYFTYYLVTKGLQTFTITVINNTSEDYQKILKSL